MLNSRRKKVIYSHILFIFTLIIAHFTTNVQYFSFFHYLCKVNDKKIQ